YQSVLVNADVYKSTKIGDVRDDSGQAHARPKIGNGVDPLSKCELFELFAGIAPRLIQLVHDVHQRWHSDRFTHVFLKRYLFSELRVANQISHFMSQVGRHSFDKRVTFRMYGPRIKRIFSISYPEEACSLLERLFAEAGNFFQ